MPREHGESGSFVETYSLDDVLGVIEETEVPVVTSADVSDALGCTRDSARRKLIELHEQGRLERHKTAGRVLYWRPDAGSDTARESGATGTDDPLAGLAGSILRQVSRRIDDPITVGDHTVYEAGDRHAVEHDEAE